MDALHGGYQVDITWRDIGKLGKQVGESAYSAGSKACRAVRREYTKPIAERARGLEAEMQYRFAMSGVYTIDRSLVTAYVMLGTAEVAVWAPELVTLALMDPQSSIDFITGLSPGTTPSMSSLGGPAGWAVGDALGIK